MSDLIVLFRNPKDLIEKTSVLPAPLTGILILVNLLLHILNI